MSAGEPVPVVGDGAAGEVDCVAGEVRDHFDDVGVVDFAGVLDLLPESAHDDAGIMDKRKNGGVDGGGIDQGLIALDVDDDLGFLLGGGDFSHAIGAGRVIGARHLHARSETSRNFEHPLIICGNDRARDIPRLRDALIDALYHGFGADGGEDFAGKTGGSESGGDHAQDFTRHRR